MIFAIIQLKTSSTKRIMPWYAFFKTCIRVVADQWSAMDVFVVLLHLAVSFYFWRRARAM